MSARLKAALVAGHDVQNPPTGQVVILHLVLSGLWTLVKVNVNFKPRALKHFVYMI